MGCLVENIAREKEDSTVHSCVKLSLFRFGNCSAGHVCFVCRLICIPSCGLKECSTFDFFFSFIFLFLFMESCVMLRYSACVTMIRCVFLASPGVT